MCNYVGFLQIHHLEYKKPETKFPTILDSFLRFTMAPPYQAGLTMGGDGGGRRESVCLKNGLGSCDGKMCLMLAAIFWPFSDPYEQSGIFLVPWAASSELCMPVKSCGVK